jgi:hypothetical protein
MRKSWRLQLAAATVGAIVLAACGGSDGANDRRQAQQPQTNAPEQTASQSPASPSVVGLQGCVDVGPGASEYVLGHVQYTSGGGSGAQHDSTPHAAGGITEGSWVRLDSQGRDLSKFAGQRVRLTGVVIDTGENTIGTAGAEGVQTPSGDRSRAAADEHYSKKVQEEAGRIARESMANGTSALVRVNAMEGTGEKCEAGTTAGPKTER